MTTDDPCDGGGTSVASVPVGDGGGGGTRVEPVSLCDLVASDLFAEEEFIASSPSS